MRYLSVCSGIEAATVAWHDLGWQPVAFSEIEPFPSAVLKQHYPDVPNLGDMTKFKEWNFEHPVDLLVGGTPCQSFSVAGLRKGLEDPRGNLALVYCGILDRFKPKWFVWENVPGVLSSSGGRDFGSFLGAVAQLGYGFAYRVLDAQYFGVAQRRRRVFVVGCLGDWQSAAKVLFEPESLRGDSAPSREKGKEVTECAGTLTANGGGLNRPAGNANELDFCIAVSTPTYAIQSTIIGRSDTAGPQGSGISEEISFTLTKADQHGVAQPIPLNTMCVMGRHSDNGRRGSGIGKPGDPCPTLTKSHCHAVAQPVAFQETADCLTAAYGTKWNGNASATNGSLFAAQPIVLMDQGGSVMNVMQDGTVGTLRRETHGHEPVVMQPIAFSCKDNGRDATTELTPTLRSMGHSGSHANGGGQMAVAQSMAVRRLTPTECERLQGFPDNYTDIKPKGKDTPDGPRYKALGNSMAVPVMEWIGRRIKDAS